MPSCMQMQQLSPERYQLADSSQNQLSIPIGSPGFIEYPLRWYLQYVVCMSQYFRTVKTREELFHSFDALFLQCEEFQEDIALCILCSKLWIGAFHFGELDLEVFNKGVKIVLLKTVDNDIGFESSISKIYSISLQCKLPPSHKQFIEICKGINSLLMFHTDTLHLTVEQEVNQKIIQHFTNADYCLSNNHSSSALKLFDNVLRNNVDCPQALQLTLWNLFIILFESHNIVDGLRVLELCSQLSMKPVLCSLDRHISDPRCLNKAHVHQTLAVLHYKQHRTYSASRHGEHALGIVSTMPLMRVPKILYNLHTAEIRFLYTEFDECHDMLNKIILSDQIDVMMFGEEGEEDKFIKCCALLMKSHLYLTKDHAVSENLVSESLHIAQELHESLSIGIPVDMIQRLYTQVLCMCGYFHCLKAEYSKAVEVYGVAYSVDDSNVSALYNQCVILVKLGRLVQAKKNWQCNKGSDVEYQNVYRDWDQFIREMKC